MQDFRLFSIRGFTTRDFTTRGFTTVLGDGPRTVSDKTVLL